MLMSRRLFFGRAAPRMIVITALWMKKEREKMPKITPALYTRERSRGTSTGGQRWAAAGSGGQAAGAMLQ